MLAVAVAAFVLSSPAFAPGEPMPARYTCDGRDTSPPLRWTAPPRGTASLALTVTDPDAPGGTFVHWRLTGIPASARTLPAGSHAGGRNSFGKTGYGGPCPPRGQAHRYVFVLRALGRSGTVLATARLVGTYAR
ncbi:MAG TPA: YbhB/YbcL family Raf kinase inhibitor-like protein [Gaiellaceae bacterium]|nr:YbhB/YbcL family Raf kinase inhibitor-like protein [Gaiellaceae bacterium]